VSLSKEPPVMCCTKLFHAYGLPKLKENCGIASQERAAVVHIRVYADACMLQWFNPNAFCQHSCAQFSHCFMVKRRQQFSINTQKSELRSLQSCKEK